MLIYATLMFLVRHLFLPLTLYLWLWKRRYRSRSDQLVMFLLAFTYTLYIVPAGDWYVSGGWVRTLLLISFGLAVVGSLRNAGRLRIWHRRNAREWFGVVISALFILVFGLLGSWALYGYRLPEEGFALDLPFKEGVFQVYNGGNSPIINSLHKYPPIPDKYAVQFVKLGNSGLRASGYFPSAVEEYAIFGEPVYSPLSGRVSLVVDTLDAWQPSFLDSITSVIQGNRLAISSGDMVVVLQHLQRGSLLVQEGDSVTSGQPLAKAGASGFVDEPLLQIHAYRAGAFPPWEGRGVPLLFNNQFLVRNSRIQAPPR